MNGIFSSTLLPAYSLWRREIVRFYRNRHRVMGAILQPLIFWALFGAGLKASFQHPSLPKNLTYAQYFFPGTLALILLFTAIFTSISLIQDRDEGFVQAVLVAPISRLALVLGKILGGTTIALLQAFLFFIFSPLLGLPFHISTILFSFLSMLLVGLSLSGLGFCFAWKFNSVQGFHAMMMVILFPLWMLSGAFFPMEGTPLWLHALMWINPLTYGVGAIRWGYYLNDGIPGGGIPPLPVCLAVTCFFTFLTLFFAMRMIRKNAREDPSES